MFEHLSIPLHQPLTLGREKQMQVNNTIERKENKVLFDLGQTVITIGAKQALLESSESPLKFLARHRVGDWGEICDADKRENDLSVRAGFRILSAYRTNRNVKIWILTEATREITTLLLPEEY